MNKLAIQSIMRRDFIRKGQDFPNNLLMQLECRPHHQCRVAYYDLPEGTSFAIDIYGLTFMLNLEPKPVLELNEILKGAHFALFPLHG